jgi:hypothetical protein
MVFKYPLKTMKILENEIKNGTTLTCPDITKQVETIAEDFAMGNALIFNEIMFYYYLVKADLSVGPSHQPVQFTSSIQFAKLDCFQAISGDPTFSIDNIDSLETAKNLWYDNIIKYTCTKGEEIPYTTFQEI